MIKKFLKFNKSNIFFLFLLLFIIVLYPVFSKPIHIGTTIPECNSVKKDSIFSAADHTNLIKTNNYLYLCGVVPEYQFYPGVYDEIFDTLFIPVFYKLIYENGKLSFLWEKEYNTGMIDTAVPQSHYSSYYGVSFKHHGNGIMYQNSLGGFDIISSATKFKDSIKSMILLSFDSDGNLISEINNIDTNLMLQRNNSKPMYIKTKENKIYSLFQNLTFNNEEDSLNLYQSNWTALEFDTLGNYIAKHSLFNLRKLANNNKFLPRQGIYEYESEKEIIISDEHDNIYILSHISYKQLVDNEIFHYKDNLLIKLNDKLESAYYIFEKDITPDTTRDVIPLAVALDKDDNIIISFMSVDCLDYNEAESRDTLYYLAKVLGKTGKVIDLKNLDIGLFKIFNRNDNLSFNMKTASDGSTYLYGYYKYLFNKNTSYLAKIDDNLNIEVINFDFYLGVPLEMALDFIDLEPGHFALVVSTPREGIAIAEFVDNSSITDENKQINILQYPNPAVEQVTLNGTMDYIGDVSISINDINGNTIKIFNTYNIGNLFNYTFAVDDIPVGIYNVLIRYDNKYIMDKLVIIR